MNKTTSTASGIIRSLPIEEWHRLGMEGDMLPVTITLEGDSMRPIIRRGKDKVTILPVNRPLKIGDIVLFRGGEKRFVVHRIYGMRDGWVQTLGDNCYNPDAWMPPEDVWGIVVRMERDGRTYRLDSDAARRWGRFWMAVYPVRRLYRRCRSFAARVYRRFFPRKGGSGNAR